MKISENGRSMIEMLGVLAIIGVLSVAGVYGYSTSIRKHRKNEIIQLVNILVSQARASDGGSGECMLLSKTDLDKTPAGIDVEIRANPEPTGAPVDVIVQIKKDMSEDELEKLCSSIQATSTTAFQIDSCVGATADVPPCS